MKTLTVTKSALIEFFGNTLNIDNIGKKIRYSYIGDVVITKSDDNYTLEIEDDKEALINIMLSNKISVTDIMYGSPIGYDPDDNVTLLCLGYSLVFGRNGSNYWVFKKSDGSKINTNDLVLIAPFVKFKPNTRFLLDKNITVWDMYSNGREIIKLAHDLEINGKTLRVYSQIDGTYIIVGHPEWKNARFSVKSGEMTKHHALVLYILVYNGLCFDYMEAAGITMDC